MTRVKARSGRLSLVIQTALVTTLLITLLPLTVPPRVVTVTVATQVKPTPAQNKALAQKMASAYGWRGKEWSCLAALWSKESAFRHDIANKQGSSAFGIAQLLGEQSKEPAVQITRGMRYITSRYDTPCKAWTFFQRKGYH